MYPDFRGLAFLLLSLLAAGPLHAGSVESVIFSTTDPPPATRLPQELKPYERPFRLGLKTMPEGTLLASALTVGGQALGLTPDQREHLAALITSTYSRVYGDGEMAALPSALPHCFSTTRPTTGHYFLHRPAKMPEDPACIVFLHGYGGNFLFYTWLLKQEFPDAVLLIPSWSMSWDGGSATFLTDMLRDAEKRSGINLDDTWLMGISAGGRGGFPIYNQLSHRFRGFVCLANAPRTADARALKPDLRILMLNAKEDGMVPVAIARRQAKLVRKRVRDFTYLEGPGTHFFLLTNRKNTFDAIRKFMGREVDMK